MDPLTFHGNTPPPAHNTIVEIKTSLALSVRTFLNCHSDDLAKQRKIRRQQNVLLDRWLLIESNTTLPGRLAPHHDP